METVKGVSSDASSVAIWYFVLPVAGKLLSDILGLSLFAYLFYQIGNTLVAIFTERKFWKVVASKLKIDCTDGYGSFRPSRIPKIQEAVLDLVSNGKWEEK